MIHRNPQQDLQATERVHRIGQTKPVRVYRLICRGSVEQRMVLRADRKMILSDMVTESAEGGSSANNNNADENVRSGPGMSQAELLSVLREGAKAVLGTSGSEAISDEQLDQILERQGRDNTLSDFSSTNAENSLLVDTCASTSEEIKPSGLLGVDLAALGEVNLRELEGVVYSKKVDVKDGRLRMVGGIVCDDALLEIDDGQERVKRARKERIVMVSGAGTGYGKMVPILADSIEVTVESELSESRRRSRAWLHMPFCCLCGHNDKPPPVLDTVYKKGKKVKKSYEEEKPEPIATRCAHCPFTFHDSCLAGRVGKQGMGMFICPHHKCGPCGRATAAAGGLLFRCTGCLIAYCEDCLPQEDVESVGRCLALENFDYDSRQAYFIRCPTCLSDDAAIRESRGEVNSKMRNVGIFEDNSAAVEDNNDEDDDDRIAVDQSRAQKPNEAERMNLQDMRLVWDEIKPLPTLKEETKLTTSKDKVKKKGFVEDVEESLNEGSGGKKKSKKNEKVEEESEEDDVEEGPPLKLEAKLPKHCSLLEGLEALCSHSACQSLLTRAAGEDRALNQAIASLENAFSGTRLRIDKGLFIFSSLTCRFFCILISEIYLCHRSLSFGVCI